MYLPHLFEETRREILHRLIAEHPLGAVIMSTPDGLTANHIPLLIEPDAGEHGTLIGHVARNNDLWRDAGEDGTTETLVIFQGPSAYISPNWYQTKRETHQVVPTYNYAVAHVHGRISAHDDPKWVRGIVGKLTKRMEAAHPVPWKMADAPGAFLESQIANIVGIEIAIERIVGKWKASQNRLMADREGAIAGLRDSGDPGDAEMADLILATIPD